MNSFFKKIFFFSVLFFLLIPFFTEAITIEPFIEFPTFKELINAILDFISWAAVVIAPILIIIAAFYFLTSGGDPEKVRTAKRIIFYTILGLIIILLARGLPGIIRLILIGPPGPPPVCVPDGCNANCPAGCTVAEDPDCGCQDGNGCCGIGCNFANDNDCPPPPVEICDNDIDDDGDTLIDCDDPDCAWIDPACPCPPNVCQDLLDLINSLWNLGCGDLEYDLIADVNKDRTIGIGDVAALNLSCGNAVACQAIRDNTFDPCVPNTPPTASFTQSATTVTVGESINFDASTSDDPDGVIVSYSWNFGDGTTGTGVTISHSWSAAGTYTITLAVTDDDGATDSATSSITVNPAPVLTVSITSPSAGQIFLQGASITFTGSAIGGVPPYTYTWTSNIDGVIGNTLTFNKNDLSVGVHTITFQVTDSAPMPVTASDSITITITDDVTPPTIRNTQVNPTSGPSGTIFTIVTDITDPLGVDSTTTIAHIQNPDETDIAQITLYDDGMHSDGAAGDGTYGGSWDSTGFPSGPYYVDITACDLIGNCGEVENI